MKREKLLELKKYIEEFKVNKMLMDGEGSFTKVIVICVILIMAGLLEEIR